jgi:polysaccharide biosynthesis transport protein
MFDPENDRPSARPGGSLLSVAPRPDDQPADGAKDTARKQPSVAELARRLEAADIARSLDRAREEAAGKAGNDREPVSADVAGEEAAVPAPGVTAAPRGPRHGFVARMRERFRRRLARAPAIVEPPPHAVAAPPLVVPAVPTPVEVTPAIADRVMYDRRPPRDEPEPRDEYWRPLVDPIAVVSGVWRAKWIILATTIIGGALGAAIALSTPKKYLAVAEILFDPRNLNIVEREITQTGLPSDATLALVENQVRIMTSTNVLRKVIDRLGLLDDPEFNGEAETVGIDIRGAIRALFTTPPDGETEMRARYSITAGNLYEALAVERGGKTFVISVGARTTDPEKSALIANTVTEEFTRTYGELQSGSAGRATEELTARLDELRAEVEKAERGVETFKAENDIVNPQGRLITDDEIIRTNEQLTAARARTLELNARAATARTADVDAALSGALPEEVNSSVMTEMRAQYAALAQEVERLSARLGPRHPQLQTAQAQLAGARSQVDAELRRIASAIQVDLRRAVQLEQELASRLAQLKARQAAVGTELVGLRELEREAAAARAVYEAFLLRARETGEQQSLNTANVSVISAAYPPILPTGPSRAMTAVVGAIIGMLVGIAIGGGRGALDSMRASGAFGDGNPGPAPRGGSRRARRETPDPHDEVPTGAAMSRMAPVHGTTMATSDTDDERERAEIEATLEDIRDSLREFRDTMNELAAGRGRRGRRA